MFKGNFCNWQGLQESRPGEWGEWRGGGGGEIYTWGGVPKRVPGQTTCHILHTKKGQVQFSSKE